MRLGIYVDGPYARIAGEAPGVATDPADFPFMTFACEVGGHFDRRIVFARISTNPGDERFRLPADVAVVPLPDFGDLRQLGRVAAAAAGTVRSFWRGLGSVDAVWVFGPHPFACALALLALVRRKHVVLGVRQDTAEYFRSRTDGGRRSPGLLAARAVDRVFRLIARRAATTAVGAQIAASYGGPSRRVHPMTVSLMRDRDVVPTISASDWDRGPIRLLTVGRIDREKNPLLLIRALAELDRDQPGRFTLTWIGTGPMAAETRELADQLRVGHLVALPGFIAFGPDLVREYRAAHAFVHVALTEGVPAVLMEALAAGLPVVATDVGGVRAALQDGAAGIVVPPDDQPALVDAIRALDRDPERRRAVAEHGLAMVRETTLDKEASRAAAFIASSSGAGLQRRHDRPM
jgi:glycosyltransferase involved in cell wall biosynthesis